MSSILLIQTSELRCSVENLVVENSNSWLLNFREMIFEQTFFDNFLFHTHIVLLLSLSIALIFVLLPEFLCIIWLSNKLSQERVFI